DEKSTVSAGGASPILKLDPGVGPHRYFEDATGQLTVEVRDLADGRHAQTPSSSHQLTHVYEGHLDVTDDLGGRQHFTAGDTFFVPFGAMTSWESDGAVRGLCCTFTPRSRS